MCGRHHMNYLIRFAVKMPRKPETITTDSRHTHTDRMGWIRIRFVVIKCKSRRPEHDQHTVTLCWAYIQVQVTYCRVTGLPSSSSSLRTHANECFWYWITGDSFIPYQLTMHCISVTVEWVFASYTREYLNGAPTVKRQTSVYRSRNAAIPSQWKWILIELISSFIEWNSHLNWEFFWSPLPAPTTKYSCISMLTFSASVICVETNVIIINWYPFHRRRCQRRCRHVLNSFKI